MPTHILRCVPGMLLFAFLTACPANIISPDDVLGVAGHTFKFRVASRILCK